MKYSCQTNQSTEQFLEIILFLKAVSDENRLKIICFLKKGEKCVCEIVDFLKLPQNLISHHLKVLREQKIVIARKEGLSVFYSLNKKYIMKRSKDLSNLIN